MPAEFAIAETLFGRPKVDSLKAAFVEADKDRDGMVAAVRLGNMLRSQGLCPSERQIKDFTNELMAHHSGQFELPRFIDICVKIGRCEHRVADLLTFFAPYDPSGSGKVPVKVFRNLMENVGEAFTSGEVDELIRDFSVSGAAVEIDYRQFLQTVTSHT